MHNWEFIPEKGKYTNGLVKKKKDFKFVKNKVRVNDVVLAPKIKCTKINSKVNIKYINQTIPIAAIVENPYWFNKSITVAFCISHASHHFYHML